MKEAKLNDMVRGWFVGNFTPTLYKTNDCEVAYKTYNKGDKEQKVPKAQFPQAGK